MDSDSRIIGGRIGHYYHYDDSTDNNYYYYLGGVSGGSSLKQQQQQERVKQLLMGEQHSVRQHNIEKRFALNNETESIQSAATAALANHLTSESGLLLAERLFGFTPSPSSPPLPYSSSSSSSLSSLSSAPSPPSRIDTGGISSAKQQDGSHLLLLFALLVLINLIVILGNILVILAVYATVKLRNVTNIFIVSLATADLLLGVFVLPYALMFEILDVWIFGKIWCRGWLVTDVWISTASILNLCAISVDRYVAVTRPVKYRSIMTPRRAKTIVAGVWIVSFLICFPPLLPQWNPSVMSVVEVDVEVDVVDLVDTLRASQAAQEPPVLASSSGGIAPAQTSADELRQTSSLIQLLRSKRQIRSSEESSAESINNRQLKGILAAQVGGKAKPGEPLLPEPAGRRRGMKRSLQGDDSANDTRPVEVDRRRLAHTVGQSAQEAAPFRRNRGGGGGATDTKPSREVVAISDDGRLSRGDNNFIATNEDEHEHHDDDCNYDNSHGQSAKWSQTKGRRIENKKSRARGDNNEKRTTTGTGHQHQSGTIPSSVEFSPPVADDGCGPLIVLVSRGGRASKMDMSPEKLARQQPPCSRCSAKEKERLASEHNAKGGLSAAIVLLANNGTTEGQKLETLLDSPSPSSSSSSSSSSSPSAHNNINNNGAAFLAPKSGASPKAKGETEGDFFSAAIIIIDNKLTEQQQHQLESISIVVATDLSYNSRQSESAAAESLELELERARESDLSRAGNEQPKSSEEASEKVALLANDDHSGSAKLRQQANSGANGQISLKMNVPRPRWEYRLLGPHESSSSGGWWPPTTAAFKSGRSSNGASEQRQHSASGGFIVFNGAARKRSLGKRAGQAQTSARASEPIKGARMQSLMKSSSLASLSGFLGEAQRSPRHQRANKIGNGILSSTRTRTTTTTSSVLDQARRLDSWSSPEAATQSLLSLKHTTTTTKQLSATSRRPKRRLVARVAEKRDNILEAIELLSGRCCSSWPVCNIAAAFMGQARVANSSQRPPLELLPDRLVRVVKLAELRLEVVIGRTDDSTSEATTSSATHQSAASETAADQTTANNSENNNNNNNNNTTDQNVAVVVVVGDSGSQVVVVALNRTCVRSTKLVGFEQLRPRTTTAAAGRTAAVMLAAEVDELLSEQFWRLRHSKRGQRRLKELLLLHHHSSSAAQAGLRVGRSLPIAGQQEPSSCKCTTAAAATANNNNVNNTQQLFNSVGVVGGLLVMDRRVYSQIGPALTELAPGVLLLGAGVLAPNSPLRPTLNLATAHCLRSIGFVRRAPLLNAEAAELDANQSLSSLFSPTTYKQGRNKTGTRQVIAPPIKGDKDIDSRGIIKRQNSARFASKLCCSTLLQQPSSGELLLTTTTTTTTTNSIALEATNEQHNERRAAYQALSFLLGAKYCASQYPLFGSSAQHCEDKNEATKKEEENNKKSQRVKRQTSAARGAALSTSTDSSSGSDTVTDSLPSLSRWPEVGTNGANNEKKEELNTAAAVGQQSEPDLKKSPTNTLNGHHHNHHNQHQQRQLQRPATKSGCNLFDDKPYVIYSALGSFYIPMLIMIFFYSRIYLVASRAHKAMQRGYMTTKWPVAANSGACGSSGASGVGGAPERVTLRIHRREKSPPLIAPDYDSYSTTAPAMPTTADDEFVSSNLSLSGTNRDSTAVDGDTSQNRLTKIESNQIGAHDEFKAQVQHKSPTNGGAGQRSVLMKLTAIEQKQALARASCGGGQQNGAPLPGKQVVLVMGGDKAIPGNQINKVDEVLVAPTQPPVIQSGEEEKDEKEELTTSGARYQLVERNQGRPAEEPSSRITGGHDHTHRYHHGHHHGSSSSSNHHRHHHHNHHHHHRHQQHHHHHHHHQRHLRDPLCASCLRHKSTPTPTTTANKQFMEDNDNTMQEGGLVTGDELMHSSIAEETTTSTSQQTFEQSGQTAIVKKEVTPPGERSRDELGSVNSVQITVSQYDEEETVEVRQPPGLSHNATSQRGGVGGGPIFVAITPPPMQVIYSGANSIDDGSSANKCERSRSVDVTPTTTNDTRTMIEPTKGEGGGGGIYESDKFLDNEVEQYARTDRSHSCGPTPTIVVNWNPDTGGSEAQLVAEVTHGAKQMVAQQANMVSTSPTLCSSRKANNSHQVTGSQGSGLSIMASLPLAANQVRKQSMMLLSTITTRSSQTLRRLSMVASHPVDSLLNRRRSRDDDDDDGSTNDYSSSEDVADTGSCKDTQRKQSSDGGATKKKESQRERRKRRQKRRRRNKRKHRSSHATKRTFDDYLMAVAGIDSSSDDDDDDEDDDDVDSEDDDDDNDANTDHRGQIYDEQSPSNSSINYSLLLGGRAVVAPNIVVVVGQQQQRGANEEVGTKSGVDHRRRLRGESTAAIEPLPVTGGGEQTNSATNAATNAVAPGNDGLGEGSPISGIGADLEVVSEGSPILRPPSGLHRQGAYYERATSRTGMESSAGDDGTCAAKSAHLKASGILRRMGGHATGNGPVLQARHHDGTGGKRPLVGLAKAQRGQRRRGAKRTSRWHAKRLHAETKAAKTVAIIIGGFIFCWLPFFTAYLSRAIICERPDCIPQSLLSVFIWLGYLNSAINPVIYGLFSADFRHAFKNILCRCRFRNTDDTVVVSALVDSIIKSIL